MSTRVGVGVALLKVNPVILTVSLQPLLTFTITFHVRTSDVLRMAGGDLGQLGGLQQRGLGRGMTGGHCADRTSLEDSDLASRLRQQQRSGQTGQTSSDDNNVVVRLSRKPVGFDGRRRVEPDRGQAVGSHEPSVPRLLTPNPRSS